MICSHNIVQRRKYECSGACQIYKRILIDGPLLYVGHRTIILYLVYNNDEESSGAQYQWLPIGHRTPIPPLYCNIWCVMPQWYCCLVHYSTLLCVGHGIMVHDRAILQSLCKHRSLAEHDFVIKRQRSFYCSFADNQQKLMVIDVLSWHRRNFTLFIDHIREEIVFCPTDRYMTLSTID